MCIRASTPAPGTPAPGVPAPGAPEPGTPGPTTPAPTAPAPGTPEPGAETPEGSAPASPAVPGTTTYPEVSAFRITSLSPNVVDTAGGTLVTVSGLALPIAPTVRIGQTATADVVQSTTTRLVFRVPARVAGPYDVSVYAQDGRSAVLSNALTYVEEVGSGPGTTTPAPPAPEDGSSGPTTPDTPPGGTSPDDTSTPPAAAPTVRTGSSGERLVRSDRFSALGSIWSLNCSASCTGVAI
ncbi:IPT/TIG domain-containing protein [Blastococcus atacamensis]|uniref:IPT/TIG domain-containing protein n=1 Tax=Blastococcus atacamensis TaxID=2070508 RepID=UPI001300146F|nr:IPT/TIG domain-containing protein [Blastococcus atacamensis]